MRSLSDLLSNIATIDTSEYVGGAFNMRNSAFDREPLKMETAKITGGRFNPKGCPALYLGLSVAGCYTEVTNGATSTLTLPQLFSTYQIAIGGILDLRGQYQHLFDSPWRIDLLRRTVPAGWRLYESVIKQPHINGIWVNSYADPERSNLVLFRTPADSVRLLDPPNALEQHHNEHVNIKPSELSAVHKGTCE